MRLREVPLARHLLGDSSLTDVDQGLGQNVWFIWQCLDSGACPTLTMQQPNYTETFRILYLYCH